MPEYLESAEKLLVLVFIKKTILGMSQLTLSKKARIHQGTLSKIERRKMVPSADHLFKLADALRIKITIEIGTKDEFLIYSDPTPPFLAK